MYAANPHGSDSLPTTTAILQMAEEVGTDPNVLAGTHSLAKRTGASPVHLPCLVLLYLVIDKFVSQIL